MISRALAAGGALLIAAPAGARVQNSAQGQVGYVSVGEPEGRRSKLDLGAKLESLWFRESPSDQSVVFWFAQKRTHPLEGPEKAGKIAKRIMLKHLLLGRFHPVTSHECLRCGWLNCAFQVQMKLGFG